LRCLDAPALINLLTSYDVDGDIEFTNRGFSVPLVKITDVESFSEVLSGLSQYDRAYPTSIVDDKVIVDTCVYNKSQQEIERERREQMYYLKIDNAAIPL